MTPEGALPMPEGDENPTPTNPTESGSGRSEVLPIEEQIRAERLAAAERQNQADEERANAERARQAHTRAENEVARTGQAFIAQNAYKKLGNFFGITGKLVERSMNRRNEYIEQARLKLNDEEAHIAQCQQELNGKWAQLQQHQERMTQLRTRLEEVSDPAKRAEIQGYIDHYDMVMLPLEDAVSRMRHEMEYSTYMSRGYSNEVAAYKEQLARSEAYMQVLRAPFSTLWSRSTRVAVGSKLNRPTFEVGRVQVNEQNQVVNQTETAREDLNATPPVETPAPAPAPETPPTPEPTPETPPTPEPEREPVPGEIVGELNRDNYTVHFERDGVAWDVPRNQLMDVYQAYATQDADKRVFMRALVGSVVRRLEIPVDQREADSSVVKNILERMVNRILPETLSNDERVDHAQDNRVRQLKNNILRKARQLAGMTDGPDKDTLRNQLSNDKTELSAIVGRLSNELDTVIG